MDHVGKMRRVLCQESIDLSKRRGDVVFRRPNTFVTETQGNTVVKRVMLNPYDDVPRNYEIWDKIGQGVGNLEGIKKLQITLDTSTGGYDCVRVREPDWEIVARILRHVRSHIELVIRDFHDWATEDVRGLSRAIYGNPMIQRFEPVNAFPFESSDVLCSALATLPALDYVRLSHQEQFI
jgi:hypothetical protein